MKENSIIREKIERIQIDKDAKVPIYKQLRGGIIDILKRNNIPSKSQLPPLRAISHKLNISLLTVSNTIQGLVGEGYLESIGGSGVFTSGRLPEVREKAGIVMSCNPEGYLFSQFLNGITQELESLDMGMELHCGSALAEIKRFIKRLVNENLVNGLIVHGYNIFQDPDFVEEIAKSLPIVAIDINDDLRLDGYVYSDDYKGMTAITELVADKGHKKVVYLSGPPMISSSQLRLRGFEDVAKKKGISYTVIEDLTREELGYLHCMRLLHEKKKFDAIVCWSDPVAAGVIRFLNSQGINVPEEIAVTGYGNLDYADKMFPRLTTVEQNFSDMGRKAADLLSKVIEKRNFKKPERIKTPVELVLRESV